MFEVPYLSGQSLPYRWTREELSEGINCGVSLKYAFASMWSLPKPVWVPRDWKVEIVQDYREFRNVFLGRANHWKSTYHYSRSFGTTVIGREKRLKEGESLDHWYLRRVMDTGVAGVVGRRNSRIESFLDQMKPEPFEGAVELPREGYDDVKPMLQIYHVERKHWTSCDLQEKYEQMFAFLTRGESPSDTVFTDDTCLPSLEHKQAAQVLWMMDVLFETDSKDIRFGPCDCCGDMVRHANEIDSVMFCCAGCEVSMCESCGEENCGHHSLQYEQWWDNVASGYHPEQYCRKCCELLEWGHMVSEGFDPISMGC